MAFKRILVSGRSHTWLALFAVTALVIALTGRTSLAQSVVFQGQTFVNKGLVGVARVPSDAKDIAQTLSIGEGLLCAGIPGPTVASRAQSAVVPACPLWANGGYRPKRNQPM